MINNGLRPHNHRHLRFQPLLAVCLCIQFALFCGTATMAQDTAATAQAAPRPGSYVAEAEKSGNVLKMTLKDAMKLALQNNLTIAIQDYESDNFEQRKIGDLGVYDPTLAFNMTFNSRANPNTSPFNQAIGAASLTSRTLNYAWELQQNIPTGANYRVQYQSNRQTSNSNSTFFSPRYDVGLNFNFTQPLVRNFRINNAKRQIKITKLDSQSNDITFEDQVTAVVKNVQDGYWDLVFAIRDHEIRRNSLELAKIQLDNNKRKVEIGTLAPIEITSAEATVASREQSVIAGLQRIHELENRLKQLLSRNSQSDIWDKIVLPTDEPLYTPTNIQLKDAVQTALANRPELRKTRNELAKMEVTESYYQNQKRPQVDFVGSFGTVGVAGGVTPVGQGRVVDRFIGGPFKANKQLFEADFRSWSVGVQIQIPLRNRTVESSLAQQLIFRRKLQKTLTDLEQGIQVEVRNAYQAIETTRQRVEAAHKGVQFAQEQLYGENKRFEAGLSTTFLVLDRQDRYEQAQGDELRALVDYRKTVAALYKAMFQTIDKNDIEIAKTASDDK